MLNIVLYKMKMFQVVPRANLRFQSAAIMALQEAAEAYLVTLFEDRWGKYENCQASDKCSEHRAYLGNLNDFLEILPYIEDRVSLYH